MGEYVKYKGEEIKIGTCENLYYATFQKYLAALKDNLLSYVRGNALPASYIMPDSGNRFRFPFPDEDKLPLGEINGDFLRGVPVTIDQSAIPEPGYNSPKYTMQITQQKLIHRQSDGQLCLAMVWRDPKGETFRVEDDSDIKKILQQIVKHHIADNPDQEQKFFYRNMAVRILKGYRPTAPSKRQTLDKVKKHSAKKTIRKGRGLG